MQVADGQGNLPVDTLGAAMQCVQAREQLPEREGFRQVIVAAAAQAADAVVDLGQGAEDEDRGAFARLAQHSMMARPSISPAACGHDDHVVWLARGQEHPVAALGA